MCAWMTEFSASCEDRGGESEWWWCVCVREGDRYETRQLKQSLLATINDTSPSNTTNSMVSSASNNRRNKLLLELTTSPIVWDDHTSYLSQ